MELSNKGVYEFIKEYAYDTPNKKMLFDEEIGYSAKEFLFSVEECANSLYNDGVREGEYVAIKCERAVDTVIWFFAVQILGAVAVMIDPHSDTEKVLSENKIRGAKRINGNAVEKCLKRPERVFTTINDSRKSTIIIFTSGSTGSNKAVMLSQYAFINNALGTYPLGDYKEEDIGLGVLPLFHVFGMAMLFTMVVLKHIVFIPKSADVEYLAECIERYQITRMNGVPTLYNSLAQFAEKYDFSSLRCGLIGGAPCGSEKFNELEKRLKITLLPVYGMSECVAVSCASYKDNAEIRSACVGKIYSMNEVHFDDDGEISVKSPAMLNGYLNGESGFSDDGFFHTGDLGSLDADGYLHIDGRKKEIIIRNGNNISIVQIENKIAMLPCVHETAVLGIAHSVCGEVPCAALVLKKEFNLSAEEILIELKEVLTKIEMPEKIIVLPELPLTSSGKPDKQKMKSWFANKVKN